MQCTPALPARIAERRFAPQSLSFLALILNPKTCRSFLPPTPPIRTAEFGTLVPFAATVANDRCCQKRTHAFDRLGDLIRESLAGCRLIALERPR